MKEKRFIFSVLISFVIFITIFAIPTIIVDPLFHYRAPLPCFNYVLNQNHQRYLNDGITRHFDYEALITGTCMTQVFKASRVEELWGLKTIKVSLGGAPYAEVTNQIDRTLQRNPDCKVVIRSLDNYFGWAPDYLHYETPDYLYDDSYFNDTLYVLNKEIFLRNTLPVIRASFDSAKEDITSFDEYGSEFVRERKAGKDKVLAKYERPKQIATGTLYKDWHENYAKSIEKNFCALAKKYPNTNFIAFIPPYSIAQWDYHNRRSEIDDFINLYQLAVEKMLEYPNIQVFCFWQEHDIIENLDNYSDQTHYDKHVYDFIVERMGHGKNLLTRQNYRAYFESAKAYYNNYNYDAIFE